MNDGFSFRRRESARLLVISPSSRVLLFRFVYKDGPLAGSDYWATPGGKLEVGESYEMAAIRELREETGIIFYNIGAPVANKEFLWQMPDGEIVMAVEKYFLVEASHEILSRDEWTPNEVEFIFESKWWSESDFNDSAAAIWPSDIVEILKAIGRF